MIQKLEMGHSPVLPKRFALFRKRQGPLLSTHAYRYPKL